jgi:hypothetical protein
MNDPTLDNNPDRDTSGEPTNDADSNAIEAEPSVDVDKGEKKAGIFKRIGDYLKRGRTEAAAAKADLDKIVAGNVGSEGTVDLSDEEKEAATRLKAEIEERENVFFKQRLQGTVKEQIEHLDQLWKSLSMVQPSQEISGLYSELYRRGAEQQKKEKIGQYTEVNEAEQALLSRFEGPVITRDAISRMALGEAPWTMNGVFAAKAELERGISPVDGKEIIPAAPPVAKKISARKAAAVGAAVLGGAAAVGAAAAMGANPDKGPIAPDADVDQKNAEAEKERLKKIIKLIDEQREKLIDQKISDPGYTLEMAEKALEKAQETAALDAEGIENELIKADHLHPDHRGKLSEEQLKALAAELVKDYQELLDAKQPAKPAPAPAPAAPAPVPPTPASPDVVPPPAASPEPKGDGKKDSAQKGREGAGEKKSASQLNKDQLKRFKNIKKVMNIDLEPNAVTLEQFTKIEEIYAKLEYALTNAGNNPGLKIRARQEYEAKIKDELEKIKPASAQPAQPNKTETGGAVEKKFEITEHMKHVASTVLPDVYKQFITTDEGRMKGDSKYLEGLVKKALGDGFVSLSIHPNINELAIIVAKSPNNEREAYGIPLSTSFRNVQGPYDMTQQGSSFEEIKQIQKATIFDPKTTGDASGPKIVSKGIVII